MLQELCHYQNQSCFEDDVAALFAAADARAKGKMYNDYYTDGKIGTDKDRWSLTVEEVAAGVWVNPLRSAVKAKTRIAEL